MSENIEKENQKLKELVEQKSNLISISAHELRTSLTAIKWILKMVLDKDMGEITTEQEKMLGKAAESNERLIELVNEMLSVNRTEDATISYKFEDTDILKLVDSVIFEFLGESYKEGVEIIFLKPDTTLPHINADKSKIKVVLQNLIENAIKYSNKKDKVFISLRQAGEDIECSVRDSGIGINEEDQKNIFNKFFRASNAIEKKKVGTGIGLMTTKDIIEKHNGKIWFKSQENQGSTFFFTLPVNK